MPGKKFGGEHVGPEDVVFAERYLVLSTNLHEIQENSTYMQIHRISMVTLPCKHSHGVMENIASTLYTLVQPCCSVALLVDWDRESLTSAVVYCIDNGNVEFVGMLR